MLKKRDELQQLSRLTQRLRIFGGNDIMYPLPGEDDWIYNEERAEAPQMHYDIPELPPRRGSCHATPEEAGNGSNTDAMI